MNRRIEKIADNLKKRKLKGYEDMELFDDKADLRSVESIATRAVISAVMAKCAFDLYEAEDQAAIKAECARTLEKFGIEDDMLFAGEWLVLHDTFDERLCDTIGWRYEAANALLWALGLQEDVAEAGDPDDVEAGINRTFELVNAYTDFSSFMESCTLRQEEELMDAYQLYWYYLWNIRDGMIFGDMPESICYDVVLERRRALQWLVFSEESDDGDWEIAMHT